MLLEEEMRHEINRLKKEMEGIDQQLQKLSAKIAELLKNRSKTEKDLNTLRGGMDEGYIRAQEEELLQKLLGKKIKV